MLEREVTSADLANRMIELADGSSVTARAVIIATGVRRKKLGVPGEDDFAGKGILSSGSKEAEKAAGKDVVIIGGGDAAVENALIIAKYARSVTLVHRRNEFRARGSFVEDARRRENINFLTNSSVDRFLGNETLEAVEVVDSNDGSPRNMRCDLALVRIGVRPNSELFRSELQADSEGYIRASTYCETSLNNVYAIGDVANPLALTIASATGDAAKAVCHIYDSNRTKYNPKI